MFGKKPLQQKNKKNKMKKNEEHILKHDLKAKRKTRERNQYYILYFNMTYTKPTQFNSSTLPFQ